MKDLLKKLIQADTTLSKGEIKAAQLIKEELQKVSVPCEVDTWDENRANAIVHLKSTGEKPALLFVCHIDVVPPGNVKWVYPPFSGTEKDGKIHGRGSVDMKGGTAAIVKAIKEIVESGVKLKGDLLLAATAGEETDSCGVKRFVESFSTKMPALAGVVLPEPTNFEVITSHRGLFWVKIVTRGKTAHGSTPHLGINAVLLMHNLLTELNEYKNRIPTGVSMSINMISGGKALNVVPDECTVGIDFRTAPEYEHGQITSDLEGIFAKLKNQYPDFNAQITVAKQTDPLNSDNNSKFIKDACRIVGAKSTTHANYATDGPLVAGFSAPVIICGPGNSDSCHKPDECIDFCEVEKAVDFYKALILEYLV
ncbi:MAG TPA: M20 family metallopeptidase [Sedimentisphaerales bacterium]|nr:M20 family metallopeptidase [Sedimentisphaerales bacterium]